MVMSHLRSVTTLLRPGRVAAVGCEQGGQQLVAVCHTSEVIWEVPGLRARLLLGLVSTVQRVVMT
jgi:hypothetical protein